MSYVKVPLLRGFTEIKNLFKEVTKRNGIICGGYARYCASQAENVIPAQDVDIFPTTEKDFDVLKDFFEKEGFVSKHTNEISITYKKHDNPKWMSCPTVQLIKPKIEGRVVTLGTMENILDNFDFSIVRAGLISPEEVLVDEDFIKDENDKLLNLKNIHCPISSTYRVIKYIGKGYWAKPRQILNLFIDWQERDDDYRIRIIELFRKGETFDGSDPDNPVGGLSQKEIDELEALMRID